MFNANCSMQMCSIIKRIGLLAGSEGIHRRVFWPPAVFRSGPTICPVRGDPPQRARRASCGGTPRTDKLWVSTGIQGVAKNQDALFARNQTVIQSVLVCNPTRKHHDQRNTVRCDLSFSAPHNIPVVTFVHVKVMHVSLRTTSHDCKRVKA